jgi:VCBS repeat-containing protein
MSLAFSITPYPTGIGPSSVAVGDLNGDGLPDLVTGNLGFDPSGDIPTTLPPGTVSVLLGNGGGTFSAATPYLTGSVLPFSVAIGDLNGDGQLDLAVANAGYNNVTVLLNTSSPTNDAPVADNDSYNVDEDTVLTVAAPGVLEGDTDADGDPLSAVLVSGPLNGSLSLSTDGSFTYTPDANFNGTDSFTYSANDGEANSNVATVAITTNSANDTPTDIALSANAVPENSSSGTVIGNLTASDPDTGDSFAFTLLDSAGGLFGINGTSLVVTGALDYEEATSHDITVRVTDSANSSFDETFTIDITNVGGVIITGTTRADTINATTSVGGQLPPTNEEDTITGGKGKDTIEALGGNDVVSGGRDADRLTGGSGNDMLSGGEGNDTFVFAAGFGNDVIQDFEAGKKQGDVIEIDHNIFADFADVLGSSEQDGSNVVITADAENSITLVNVSLANLNVNDFHFV